MAVRLKWAPLPVKPAAFAAGMMLLKARPLFVVGEGRPGLGDLVAAEQQQAGDQQDAQARRCANSHFCTRQYDREP